MKFICKFISAPPLFRVFVVRKPTLASTLSLLHGASHTGYREGVSADAHIVVDEVAKF